MMPPPAPQESAWPWRRCPVLHTLPSFPVVEASSKRLPLLGAVCAGLNGFPPDRVPPEPQNGTLLGRVFADGIKAEIKVRQTGLGWALHPISVLLKDREGPPDPVRRPGDAEIDHSDAGCIPRMGRLPSSLPRHHGPRDTLALDFRPPGLWEKRSCCFKAPSLWGFVRAAVEEE